MNATDGVKRDVPTTASPESWNVTTNLGTTALMVAALRAAETAQDDPRVRDDFATVLVTAVSDPGWLAMAQREPSGPLPMTMSANARRAPGANISRREPSSSMSFAPPRQCQAFARSSSSPGLDARAYRLACPADVHVYEIDQPEVQAFKDAALSAHGAVAIADLHPVPIDLRDENWPSALVEAGWDRSMQAAWLVEGLLPYLSSAEHDQLFLYIDQLERVGKPCRGRGRPPRNNPSWRDAAGKLAEERGRDG